MRLKDKMASVYWSAEQYAAVLELVRRKGYQALSVMLRDLVNEEMKRCGHEDLLERMKSEDREHERVKLEMSSRGGKRSAEVRRARRPG